VGGRDDSHVDLHHPLAAERLHLALLHCPQHLRLGRRPEVADLVEKERAAVGQRELAPLLPRRPRERPLFVAEELGLDHRLGDGRAVERDEGLVRPRRERVQRARHQLFARAALAPDEHVRARRRELADVGPQPPHRLAGAHDLAELAARPEIFGHRRDALVALGALECCHRQAAERAQEVEVVLGEAPRLAPVVDVEQPEHPLAHAERHAHRRQDALAQQRVRRRRVAHDDRLAPHQRRLDERPAQHHLAPPVAAPRSHDAAQRRALDLLQADEPPLAAQHVDDRLEHSAEQHVGVFEPTNGARDVVKDAQPLARLAAQRGRLDRRLVVHELGRALVGLGERQQHLPDLHLVVVGQRARLDPLAVHEGAVRRGEVLHYPAPVDHPEGRVLARHLGVVEHDRVLAVAPYGHALAQLDRVRDAVRLSDDKKRHEKTLWVIVPHIAPGWQAPAVVWPGKRTVVAPRSEVIGTVMSSEDGILGSPSVRVLMRGRSAGPMPPLRGKNGARCRGHGARASPDHSPPGSAATEPSRSTQGRQNAHSRRCHHRQQSYRARTREAGRFTNPQTSAHTKKRPRHGAERAARGAFGAPEA
jgi:hypothetical protein